MVANNSGLRLVDHLLLLFLAAAPQFQIHQADDSQKLRGIRCQLVSDFRTV